MNKFKNKNPKVCLLVLNWNGLRDTEECIDSLLKINYNNSEIVIIDNGSKDGSVDFFRKKYDNKIKIISNSKNLGYSGGFNSGIDYSVSQKFDYTLTMSNDLIVDSEFVGKLVSVAESNDNVGIVTGKSYYYGTKQKILQRTARRSSKFFLVGSHIGVDEVDIGQCDQIKEYDYVDDVFWLLSNKALKKVGGYDAENFFFMGEELDLIYRIRREGFRVFYTPHSVVWHKVNSSLGGRIYDSKSKSPKKSKSNLMHYMYARSQMIIFYRRHLPHFHLFFYLLYNTFIHLPYNTFQLFRDKDFQRAKSLWQGYKRGILWEFK